MTLQVKKKVLILAFFGSYYFLGVFYCGFIELEFFVHILAQWRYDTNTTTHDECCCCLVQLSCVRFDNLGLRFHGTIRHWLSHKVNLRETENNYVAAFGSLILNISYYFLRALDITWEKMFDSRVWLFH